MLEEIQAHKVRFTSWVYVRKRDVGKWITYTLNEKGLAAINARLAEESPDKRWIAMTLTFE